MTPQLIDPLSLHLAVDLITSVIYTTDAINQDTKSPLSVLVEGRLVHLNYNVPCRTSSYALVARTSRERTSAKTDIVWTAITPTFGNGARLTNLQQNSGKRLSLEVNLTFTRVAGRLHQSLVTFAG